jgi:pyridoxamine--pyruvate transaminase
MRALGLSLWPAREEIASPALTAVRIPDGLDGADIVAAVRRTMGVAVSEGQGDTLGKLLRIGHMGSVAQPIYSVVAVSALAAALRHLGMTCDLAAGVEAAMAVIRDASADGQTREVER